MKIIATETKKLARKILNEEISPGGNALSHQKCHRAFRRRRS